MRPESSYSHCSECSLAIPESPKGEFVEDYEPRGTNRLL